MQTENGEGMAGAAPPNTGDEPVNQSNLGAETGWKFEAEPLSSDPENVDTGVLHTNKSVSWTASEYVAHHKTVVWFAGLGLAIAVLALGVYLLTQEKLSAIVIVIIGLSFGVFGARQPRVLQYALDEKGLHVGGKLYLYAQIKSFSVLQEGSIRALLLMPLQRFMPPLTVYYDPADEEKIIEVISQYIPHEEHEHDLVDKLMSKIRF